MAKAKTKTKAKTAPKAKRTPVPWKERNLAKSRGVTKWLQRLQDEIHRSGYKHEDVDSALVYVNGVTELIGAFDDDWEPEPRRRNGAFQAGDSVGIKEDVLDAYVFIPDVEKKLEGATIVDIFDKNTVLVQLSDGVQTLIQKRHLTRVY